MNTHEQNKDIEKEEVFAKELQELFATNTYAQKETQAMPSHELLHSTLQKISQPIPSPFSWTVFVSHKKGLVVAALALVIIVGGMAVVQHGGIGSGLDTKVLSMNAGDTSDAALSNDASAIDNQLNGLDSDNVATDQVLGN